MASEATTQEKDRRQEGTGHLKALDPILLERLIENVLEGMRDFEHSDLVPAIADGLHRSRPRLLFLAADEHEEVEALIEGLGERFDIQKTASYRSALDIMESETPDAAVLDIPSSGPKAMKFLRRIQKSYPGIASIVFTNSDEGREQAIEAFRQGASDVLAHPLESQELRLALERAFERERASLLRQISVLDVPRLITGHAKSLMSTIEELRGQAGSLSGAYRDVVARLCRASHWRDDETGDHITRIGLFSRKLSRKLGLPTQEVEIIGEAAPLHDIGKIGVPDKILLKPGRLTDIEFEWMKTHTLIGAEILSGSSDPLLQAAETIALTHHEWFNGHGYPYALKGEDIHLYGRIVTLVDVYDAMTHRRSYKKPVPLDETIETMHQRRGIQFDPDVFDAFLEIVEDLMNIERDMTTKGPKETKYQIHFGIHSMSTFLAETMKKE